MYICNYCSMCQKSYDIWNCLIRCLKMGNVAIKSGHSLRSGILVIAFWSEHFFKMIFTQVSLYWHWKINAQNVWLWAYNVYRLAYIVCVKPNYTCILCTEFRHGSYKWHSKAPLNAPKYRCLKGVGSARLFQMKTFWYPCRSTNWNMSCKSENYSRTVHLQVFHHVFKCRHILTHSQWSSGL